MKKALREKLISLNNKKVRLITKWEEVIGTLTITFEGYQNDNFLKGRKMSVHCGTYEGYPLGHSLNSIIDVEEI